MEISVRTSKLENSDNAVKGLATISFGDVFKVHSVSIMEGKKGLFVTMPSYKTKQVDEEGKAVYKDICNPTTKEFRSELYDAILESFEKGKEIRFTFDTGRAEEREELPFVDGERPLELSYGMEEKKEEKRPTPQKKDNEPKTSIKDKLAAGEAKKEAAVAEKALEDKASKGKATEIA